MKLISCYIENFGLLHTVTYNFSKGLNCCVSENGTGKTTLTAFIEAMLYGIGDTRKQALDDNPRKKYYPWQGGKFGGSLTLEVGKKSYMIERSFGAKAADDTFRLIDADSGRVSDDYGENIGESLFGIDRDGFLRTAFLSEKNLRGKNENKSISAKLSDLVGVDGDVGEFDEAIKLLEDRRKFYHKKGNTGEIANVKEKINEAQRRIDALVAIEAATLEKEAALKEMHAKRAALHAMGENTRTKLEALSYQRERKGHEEIYSTMIETLRHEAEELASVKAFFQNGLPTVEDVDKARDNQNESERLKAEALSERGDEEYVALDEFFKNGTSFPEVDSALRSAELAEEKEKEIAAIDNGTNALSKEMQAVFPEGAPTREEFASVKHKMRKSLLFCIPTVIGLAMVCAGVLLGGALTIPLLTAGFVLTCVSAGAILLGKNRKEMLSFLEKYNGSGSSWGDLEKRIDRYDELRRRREDARSSASEEYSALTLKVCDFLGKFPVPDADSMLEAVRSIRQKYTHYYALGRAGEVSASGKLDKMKRSEELAASVRDFLKKFPTVTDSPFSEIRDKLISYSQHKSNIARLEKECDEYAVKYGVTGKAVAGAEGDESTLKMKLAEISDSERALAASISLTERDINIARTELDRKEEYEMEKEELEELYLKHVESLEVIKKASAYLTEACDNITSKYLGKTKEKFEEYSRLIAGVEGDYTLNTSFELMRTERGEAHGIDSYSRGIRDLYSLGLRLALIDALYENEAPFIILDDPFIAFDDEKLERAKSTLKTIGKTKQILYFTCARSRVID